MPVRLHVLLTMACRLAGCFIAAYLATVYRDQLVESAGLGRWFTVVVPALLGFLVPAELFKLLVPAKCIQCGVRAYHGRRGAQRPINYLCRDCDRIPVAALFASEPELHAQEQCLR